MLFLPGLNTAAAALPALSSHLQGSVLSNIADLRTSMSGGSTWIGHGTAMGPDR